MTKEDLLALTASLAPEEFVQIALQLRDERDALRAENIQLRQNAADHWTEIEQLRAENATLRQDVTSLAKGYEDRIIEIHAEKEFLRVAEQRRREEVETAMAEVVRLRAALRRITEQGRVCAEFESCTHMDVRGARQKAE